jgi:hypothetical protein
LTDPQQHNMYAYARGNPVNLVDPSGESSCFSEFSLQAPDGSSHTRVSSCGGSIFLGGDYGISLAGQGGGFASITDRSGVLGSVLANRPNYQPAGSTGPPFQLGAGGTIQLQTKLGQGGLSSQSVLTSPGPQPGEIPVLHMPDQGGMWTEWMVGGLAGGAAGVGVRSVAAWWAGRGAVKVGEYGLTRTVAGHLDDIVTKGPYRGEPTRPFLESPSTIREIIGAGNPIRDPGGIAGALRYDVPGAFRGTQGTWELVIHPSSRTIYHFNFVGGP